MSWLFSRALVEEYSEANSLDGAPCALWSGMPMPPACSWLGKTMAACRLSRSGMMFKPLTDAHGEAVLMSFLAAFRAQTSPVPEREQASTEKPVPCGGTWQGSLGKFDPVSSSWRTHQLSLFGGLEEFSEIWPGWGIMRDGEYWEQSMPDFLTEDCESGLFATPRTSIYKNQKWWVRKEYMGNLEELPMVKGFEHLAGKRINPEWLEWLMAWPIGWAALAPLATDKFQQWLHSHGNY
jgi:hypothetical protein